MKKNFRHIRLEHLPDVAHHLAGLAKNHVLFAFYGPMGSGKTTLIGELVQLLINAPATVTSPTFSLVNVYRGDQIVYHFDLYRINKAEEAIQAGLDEMMNDGTICLIEWPEKIGSLLPDNVVKITLHVEENRSERSIEIKTPDHD